MKKEDRLRRNLRRGGLIATALGAVALSFSTWTHCYSNPSSNMSIEQRSDYMRIAYDYKNMESELESQHNRTSPILKKHVQRLEEELRFMDKDPQVKEALDYSSAVDNYLSKTIPCDLFGGFIMMHGLLAYFISYIIPGDRGNGNDSDSPKDPYDDGYLKEDPVDDDPEEGYDGWLQKEDIYRPEKVLV